MSAVSKVSGGVKKLLGYDRRAQPVDALELDIEMLTHPEHGYRLELPHRPGSAGGGKAVHPEMRGACGVASSRI
jgi:hypothetical protein